MVLHTSFVYRSARKISRCARNDNAGARGLLATRHKSLAIHPCFQIFGDIHFPYRHPERSRGIFLALRSVSHRHCTEAAPWCCTHPLFIGLQGRSLGYARDDDGAKRYQNSAALLIFMRRITIPNSSFEQSFHPLSRGGTPRRLTPNPLNSSIFYNFLPRFPV